MDSFAELLGDYLNELTDLRQRGASEDSIRDAFLRFLHAAFPRLQQADPILLEKHIPGMRVRGGFADALYADLIFECKKGLDESSRAAGQEELTRYIGNQTHPEHHLGILTDGELLEVYALRDESLDRVDELRLSVLEANHAHTWLDCYLFHEKHLTPTANDVALRFGEHSATFYRCLRILEELWKLIGNDAAAQTKFAEWQSLLSIAYGSQVGDEELFLRHTYLALFARVLAFVVLQRRAPRDLELDGIVSGASFERFGLENFIEEDFFTWPAFSNSATGKNDLLRALATRLTVSYDLNAIREDLLKELYQELVDPETRHDLGEFYTPDWLAELTLREAGFPPKSLDATSLLDPSCGSGTFLFTAVRLLRERGNRGKTLVEFCRTRLAGIDVHPLAVTIAKTNVVLALGKDVETAGQPITLRVFMADTLAMPQPALQENVVRIPVDVDSLANRARKSRPRTLHSAFEFPEDLADSPDRLHAALEALLTFANSTINDADALKGLSQRLSEMGLINGRGHVWRGNLDLMRWLLRPPVTNTVWRFILRNAYQPELLAREKFDFVAGNPPWLSYRYIKRPDYQKRVRELVYKYGLLSKAEAHLATQMELATLFFSFCASRYLAPHGILAFVMPRSILTGAKQHAAFREQYLLSSQRIVDCEKVLPLFNVPACVVIREQDDGLAWAASQTISLLHVSGVLPAKNASLTDARKALHFAEGQFKAKL